MPLFGKITAIHDSTIEISNPNGETVTVKITPKRISQGSPAG